MFHAAVYLVDGGPWEGPVSWRKPIVFGLSFGITVLTVSWFLTFLRLRKATAWFVVGVLALASLGEVFLISMQKWRGVASHFNEEHRLRQPRVLRDGHAGRAHRAGDGRSSPSRSFGRIDAPPSLAWAIRTGLVLDDRQPGGRGADDRRGRQHLRRSGSAEGAARLHLARRPGTAGTCSAAAVGRLHRTPPHPRRGARRLRVRTVDRGDDAADVRRPRSAGPGPRPRP